MLLNFFYILEIIKLKFIKKYYNKFLIKYFDTKKIQKFFI